MVRANYYQIVFSSQGRPFFNSLIKMIICTSQLSIEAQPLTKKKLNQRGPECTKQKSKPMAFWDESACRCIC
jgi:hypothetical protein